MNNSVAVLLLAFLAAVTPSIAADERTLADLEKKLETIETPIRVTEAEMYRDGGTISLAFQDAKGIAVELTIDRSMSSSDPGAVYYGGHPRSEPTPAKLPAGGPLEKRVLELLKKWLAGKPDSRHTGYVQQFVEGAEAHARTVGARAAKGALTRDEAIELARKQWPDWDKAARTDVEEKPDTITVKFVDIPFTDSDGTKKRSTMNVVLARSTGEMVMMHASDVRNDR